MPDLETLLNIENEVTQVLSDLGVTAKLDEMDDFMNQNDLKVSITNESNAATTGLVTYTCTVKDKDNTALANRVVEWYNGTTLLGLDATDSNGISTFNHKVTTADIFDVHAVVRGTHAGDDIRMFVKDKKNILAVNVWSGGQYSQNTTGLYVNSTLTYSVSSDWSSIGDESFLVEATGDVLVDLIRLAAGSFELGSYTLKMDVYNIGPSFKVSFFHTSSNYQRVTIPESDEVTPVEITLTPDSSEAYLSCRVSNSNGVKFYCDNIRITPTTITSTP